MNFELPPTKNSFGQTCMHGAYYVQMCVYVIGPLKDMLVCVCVYVCVCVCVCVRVCEFICVMLKFFINMIISVNEVINSIR